jgi:hypothetical protein
MFSLSQTHLSSTKALDEIPRLGVGGFAAGLCYMPSFGEGLGSGPIIVVPRGPGFAKKSTHLHSILVTFTANICQAVTKTLVLGL